MNSCLTILFLLIGIFSYGQQLKGVVIHNQTLPSVSAFQIKYPREALKHNIQGIVKLQVEFDDSCAITKVSVLEGLGYGCDQEAVRIIQHREELRKKHGIPPDACPEKKKIVPITFVIDQ